MNSYKFFEQIICINLLSRPQRKNHAQEVFRKLHIPAIIHSVEIDENGGIRGCFKSHIEIIKKAYNHQYHNVLIFEDDIEPTPSYSTTALDKCIKFMKTDENWDIFYLGFFTMNWDTNPLNTLSSSNMVTEHIVKYNPLATHAYVLSRRGMKKILESYEKFIDTNTHYDIYLAKYANLQSYCYVPMLFNQKMCMPSDVESGNTLEKFARQTQCKIVDEVNIFYKLSLMKYWMEIHKWSIAFIILILCICLVIFV